MTAITKRKKIVFYLILVFVAYFLTEVASLAVHYLVRHERFSFAIGQRDRVAIVNTLTRKQTRGFGVVANGDPPETVYEVLHPFLGFVQDPTGSPTHSKYGFPDSEAVTYSKDPNTIIVGIFGGSFAQGVAALSEDVIINELKASPRFASKQIKVLTLSMGGYKQPQQLLALAFLLSLGTHFDVVVNLDGFNEVALPTSENIPKGVFPFYPRNWFALVGGFDDALLALREKHEELTEDRRDWALLFARAPIRFSVAANVLWTAYDAVLIKKLRELEMAALAHRVPDNSAAGYIVRGPSFRYVDEDAMYADLARMWKTASIQMKSLASANGITYLHFLQPNQYLSGSKRLHAEELQKAYDEDHPYRRGVQFGYPKLIESGKELTRGGVLFYDLTMALANHEEPLYVDSCCHLGKEGYNIIASTIGQMIVRHLDHDGLEN
jgi:hypothetical protein